MTWTADGNRPVRRRRLEEIEPEEFIVEEGPMAEDRSDAPFVAYSAGGTKAKFDAADEAFGYAVEHLRRNPRLRSFTVHDAWNGRATIIKTRMRPPEASRVVYVIRDAEVTGLVKIGVTGDPYGRLGALQTGSPTKLELLAVVTGDERVEGHLHEVFNEAWHHGEWFDLSDQARTAGGWRSLLVDALSGLDLPAWDRSVQMIGKDSIEVARDTGA